MVCRVKMPLCWHLYLRTWTFTIHLRVASSIAIRRTLTIPAFARDLKLADASSLRCSKTDCGTLLLESRRVNSSLLGPVEQAFGRAPPDSSSWFADPPIPQVDVKHAVGRSAQESSSSWMIRS